MLLRYSRHLAAWPRHRLERGRATSGRRHRLPVHAAGGLLHAARVSLEAAAQAIGLLAHAATVVIVYLCARRQSQRSPCPRLRAGGLPGRRTRAPPSDRVLRHSAFRPAGRARLVGRGPLAPAEPPAPGRPRLAVRPASPAWGWRAPKASSSGVFLLAVIVLERGRREGATLVRRFVLVFLTLGLAYFLWRWHYFGYPLPEPLLQEGRRPAARALAPHGLAQPLGAVACPSGAARRPGLLVRKTSHRRLRPAAGGGLRGPLGAHLRRDQLRHALPVPRPAGGPHRVFGRGLPGFVRPAVRDVCLDPSRLGRAPRGRGGLAVYQHDRFRHVAPKRMGLYDAALVLRDYGRRNYALATTEAGLLPLYSTWRAVDAWGLNDAWIAHHGGITEEYLDRYRPEVIVFHAYFSPETPRRTPRRGALSGPRLVSDGHDLQGLRRAERLRPGRGLRPQRLGHALLLRAPRLRDSPALVDRLRSLDYYWDGEPTANFAPPPAASAMPPDAPPQRSSEPGTP